MERSQDVSAKKTSHSAKRVEGGQPRVAFVHDWLVTYRGGEKVLEALFELFPHAPVFTLFHDAAALPASFQQRKIIVPPMLNHFRRLRKALLPFLPAAIEAFDLWDYDLIVSTSSCVAKGALPGPSAKHVCYLHSPMRYIWDQRRDYLKGLRRIPGAASIAAVIGQRLRLWDVASCARVDQFICNSSFVGARTQRYYGRSSDVIHPPVDAEKIIHMCGGFTANTTEPYAIIAGAFVPYKRIDLAIKACEALKKPLVVAGSGPEEESLRKLAGPMTRFVIKPSDDELMRLMAGAEVFLFPGVEDFGIIGVEAMACGTPVLALAAGGALDFVEAGVSGCFFGEAEVECLKTAIASFRPSAFDRKSIQAHARKFDRAVFLEKMRQQLRDYV